MILCGTVEWMFSFSLLKKTQISPIIFKLIVLYCCPRKSEKKNLFVCSFHFFSMIKLSSRRLIQHTVRYFPLQHLMRVLSSANCIYSIFTCWDFLFTLPYHYFHYISLESLSGHTSPIFALFEFLPQNSESVNQA